MVKPRLTRWELAGVMAAHIAAVLPGSQPDVQADDSGDPEVRFQHPAMPGDADQSPYQGTAGTGSHWRAYQNGTPLGEILARVAGAITDMDHLDRGWAACRDRLMIQLVPEDDWHAMEADIDAGMAKRGHTPEGGLLAQPWACGVAARVCIDQERSILGATTYDPERWGQSAAEVWRRALDNTRRACSAHGGTRVRQSSGATFRIYNEPHGYAASRVLWPDLFGTLAPTRHRLLIAPQRDLLVIADVSQQQGYDAIERGIIGLAQYQALGMREPYRAFPGGTVLIQHGSRPGFRQIFPLQTDGDDFLPGAAALVPGHDRATRAAGGNADADRT